MLSTTPDPSAPFHFWCLNKLASPSKNSSSTRTMKSFVFVEIQASKCLFSLDKKNIIYQEFAYRTFFNIKFGICEESSPKRHLWQRYVNSVVCRMDHGLHQRKSFLTWISSWLVYGGISEVVWTRHQNFIWTFWNETLTGIWHHVIMFGTICTLTNWGLEQIFCGQHFVDSI